jgi:hypothetical protein
MSRFTANGNIAGDAIDIQDVWVQKFWNIGVDVYKGVATARKVQIEIMSAAKAAQCHDFIVRIVVFLSWRYVTQANKKTVKEHLF